MTRISIPAIALATCFTTLPALAALTAAQATQIVHGCAEHAAAKKQSHAIAVYDDGGHVVASLRMEGNAFGVMDFAMQKAEAAAAWRFSTRDMEGAAKETPGFARAAHVATVAGGIPVFSPEGQFIGAVGVSGEAPQDDAACAEAGIRAAGLLPARMPKR